MTLDTLGKKTASQVWRRLGILIFILSVMSWLDRANVSFAALDMNAELGFDPKTFGFGVGLFSVTHILFQLPMAAAAARFGCRPVIALMMVAWGVLAACMGLIHDAPQFYAIRLLLGFAESGVGPVTLFYISRWIPQERMGSFLLWVMLSVPFGVILGAPLSGFLIVGMHDLLGFAGWRWMFLVEGLPAIVLGLFVAFWLTELPEDARWLSPERKAWLIKHLRGSATPPRAGGGWGNLRWILRDPTVLAFAAILFCIVTGLQGLIYWLPQVIHELARGASKFTVIMLSALPWLGAAAGMVTVAVLSDRTGERHRFLAGSMLLGAAGILLSVQLADPLWNLMAMTVGLFGLGGSQSVILTVPMARLRNREGAALALTTVNFLGFSAGIISPLIIGELRQTSGGFGTTLVFVASSLALGGAIALADRRRGVAVETIAPLMVA
jgi:ACS family tartrate transporter-like MFS transporter